MENKFLKIIFCYVSNYFQTLVFEQNTEIVEDCKARFEDNLQKKSEWISRELEKLSARVQELEELGEINSIQQYTYVSHLTDTYFILENNFKYKFGRKDLNLR